MFKSPPVASNSPPISSTPLANSEGARADRLAKVRAALGSVARKNEGAMYALRLAVSSFTAELRDEGMTPEAVLILFKAAIEEISLAAPYATSTRSGPTLRETLSTWCIEDYFAQERLSLPITTSAPERASI